MIELYPDTIRELDVLASMLAGIVPDGSLRIGNVPVLDRDGHQIGVFMYNEEEYCWVFKGHNDYFVVGGE